MTARPCLLKLSGEVLKGDAATVLDEARLARICAELVAGAASRPLAVVVGGGNIFRGRSAGAMADPLRGDYLGMLATLFNALALKDGIELAGGRAAVFAPHAVPGVARRYERDAVRELLASGTLVVFGGGTGHPCFTTDTTAALRAAEIGAELLLKGSNVDGIYDRDPAVHPEAERFDELSFDAALSGGYAIMDQAAFSLCYDRGVAIRVFDLRPDGALAAALGEDPPGTLVH